MGFVLAHPWHSLAPPPLFKPLVGGVSGEFLFIHDLVVSRASGGRGVGRIMAEHLMTLAKQLHYRQVLLVSVQDSMAFWQKFGFEPVDQPISSSYGEGAVFMSQTLS